MSSSLLSRAIVHGAYIASASPTTNFGTYAVFSVGSVLGTFTRALIRLDLTKIAAGLTASQYLLDLTDSGGTMTGADTFGCYELTTTSWMPHAATWNSPWTTPGGDFTATNAALWTGGVGDNMQFDITAKVNEKLALSATTLDLIIKLVTEPAGNQFKAPHSHLASLHSNRPLETATLALTAPTLAITDAADGTGGTAAVSGGATGATNTLYVGSWAGGVGGVTSAVEGSRTGNGNITMTLTPGYYWGWVVSSLGGIEATSSLVYFRITDADDEVSISYQYQLAVQARIQSLALSGITNSNIAVKKLPWHRATDTYPQIIITGYLPESFPRGAGTNQRNDVGYPVTVTILEADNQNLTANHERNLLWRQRIVQACIDRQIEPSLGAGNSHGICTVEPNTVVVPDSFANNVFHSSFVLRFTARQTRGI